jgi:hypothetical protein
LGAIRKLDINRPQTGERCLPQPHLIKAQHKIKGHHQSIVDMSTPTEPSNAGGSTFIGSFVQSVRDGLGLAPELLGGASRYETSANPGFSTGSAAIIPSVTGGFSKKQSEILSAVASRAESSNGGRGDKA